MRLLKFTLITFLSLTFGHVLVAQSEDLGEGFNCGQHRLAKALLEDPGYAKNQANFEKYLQVRSKEILANKSEQKAKYIIPIVFHVVHKGGSENISYEQIKNAVSVLNEEFNMKNAALSGVVAEFKDDIGDAQIEFRLATIDPNGNCTQGIVRYFDTRTSTAGDEVKVGRQWPANKYLNVYTCSRIASGAAGYAYFPGISADVDGVLIIHSYVGRIGTGSQVRSSALTHEVGHYLALNHTWGPTNEPGQSTNCNFDDQVEDTPNCQGTGTCNLKANSCGVGTEGDKIDNVQNFMDYAYCYAMYTKGQAARMQATLQSNVGNRINLWQASNLEATGANYDGDPTKICVADFDIIGTKIVCEGNSVKFVDKSYFEPSTWKWTFEGAEPASSTEQNPTIKYTSAGVFNVTLEVGNASGTVSITKTEFVSVLSNNGASLPFIDDFEDKLSLSPYYSSTNADDDKTWGIFNEIGFGSERCVFINNFSTPAKNRRDELVTVGFNIDELSLPVLTFNYAFAAKNTASTDALLISYSDDCGTSYKTLKTLSVASLKTVADMPNSDFIPSNDTEWKMESIDLNAIKKPGVRFKFTWISGLGNNFFMDNLNVKDAFVGINSIQNNPFALTITPNPSNGLVKLNFTTENTNTLEVAIYDLVGKKLKTLTNANFTQGKQSVTSDLSDLKAGVYLVSVSNNELKSIQKIVIQ